MKKIAMIFKNVLTSIVIGLMLFGAYKVLINKDVNPEIKEKLYNQSSEHPLATLVFIKSLDDLTPSSSYKIPATEKKIFLLNQFPLISYTHALVIGLLILLAMFILWFTNISTPKTIILFLCLMVIGYFLASIILLTAYKSSSAVIGFTAEESKTFYDQYNSGYAKVALPFLITSAITLLSIIISILKNAKRN